MDWDHSRTWYHGSQQPLAVLRVDSSITQNRDLASAFSHRPSLLSVSDDGKVKHNGTTPGYLYFVCEEIRPEDIYPHPHPANLHRWEWLTRRELRVQLIEPTQVRAEETLTDEQIAQLRRKQQEKGVKSFAE